MKEITLDSGFVCQIDEAALDDQELLDDLVGLDQNPARYSSVLVRLFGEEQKKALYEHLRNKGTGRVPATLVAKTVGEVFSKLNGKAKN